MRKNLIISILLLLTYFEGNCGKYKVTVALNLKDCINCVKAFYRLTGLADQVDVVLVMNEEYKSDSAYIFQTYELNKLKPTVKWSDTLFAEYAPWGATTISLESEHGTERIQYTPAGLNDPFFTYLKKAALDTDTLFKNVPGITKGVKYLKFDGKNLAMKVDYRKEINVYDLVTQSKQYTITVPDSLLRKTFTYSGLPASAYDVQQQVMKEAGVPERYQFKDFVLSKDTLTLQLNTGYFQYRGADTFFQYNFSFLKYVKGKFLDVHKLQIRNRIYGETYDNLFSKIHYYNGQLYENIGNYPLTADRYFLGKCNLVRDTFIINEAYGMKIPALYKNTIGCSFLLYYKGYFALPLIGTLFPLDIRGSNVQLPFFENMREGDCSSAKNFIYSFLLNENYVWLTMLNTNHQGGDQLELLKYNRKTKDLEVSSLRFTESENNLMAFDPVNPDFFIYKSAGGYLIRKRAFK
jgi:hypothetical protein